MDPANFSSEDICDFAQYMGLKGVDSDLFYETYYELDSDQLEVELAAEVEAMYEEAYRRA